MISITIRGELTNPQQDVVLQAARAYRGTIQVTDKGAVVEFTGQTASADAGFFSTRMHRAGISSFCDTDTTADE